MRKQGTPARRSPSRNPQTNLVSILAAIWRGLSEPSRVLWNQANARLYNPANPNKLLFGPTGYTCFIATNSNRASLQMPVTQSVPSDMTPALALPPCRINIPQNDDLIVTLLPDWAIPAGRIIVSATPATPIGNTTWRPSSYKKIGVITAAIPVTGFDLAPMLLSLYPRPGLSSQIGFRFTPVSAHGVSNTDLFVTALTPLAMADAATETGDDTKEDGDLHIA